MADLPASGAAQELDLTCLETRKPQWALPAEAPDTTVDEAAPATDEIIDATFVCPDGTSIDVEFDNGARTATVALPEGTVTLPQVESASGARYSDGTTTFWNKGNEATIEVDGETLYESCVA